MLDDLDNHNPENLSSCELTSPSESMAREALSTSIDSHTTSFRTTIALNPMLAAAAPLLTIASQLREQMSTPNIDRLHTTLADAIKTFENKAHALSYRSQVILGARYLLCALIDEIIGESAWGQSVQWQQQGLLKTFQRETNGGERFFLILQRGAEDPALYLDLLELGYICLSLGFQGKFRGTKQQQQLITFIDNLYDIVRQQRGEFSRRLLIAPPPTQPSHTRRWRLPPVWLSLVIAGLIAIAIFVPYYHRLEKLSQPLQQTLELFKSNKS